MNRFKHLIKHTLMVLVPAAIMLISACEPEVVTTIDLPEEDPMLAISAYLLPSNAAHNVFIGKSKPNNKPTDSYWEVENAVVTVSDGLKSVTLKNMGGGYYSFLQTDLEVLHGMTYHITAYAPGFAKVARGTCTVPDDFDPQVQVIAFDSVVLQDSRKYSLDFKFRDVPGEGDCYRVYVRFKMYSYIEQDTSTWTPWSNQAKYKLFTDKGVDGEWFNIKLSITNSTIWDSERYPVGYEIVIMRVDEHYYKFHYPFVVYDYYPDDNPFAEPFIIYSNIENGYGIFAAAIEKKYLFNL
ncbi:MAG: DUF4249 family protein [Bacteroidales bacterium]